MPGRKIQDEQEVLRWFEEGRTYSWMQQEYLDKYNIETTPRMWSNFRRRRGLPHRMHHDESLIPWVVMDEHRHRYPVAMLRKVARQRRGDKITERDQERIDAWLNSLADGDAVVHYDPQTEEGFFYVPRRPGIDKDLIREPERIKFIGLDQRKPSRTKAKQG